MKKWMRNILKFFPIKYIWNYVMEELTEEAAKTETDLDDIAVKIAKEIGDVWFGK